MRYQLLIPLLMLGFLTGLQTGFALLNAESLPKFPQKLNFTVYQNNQSIGQAALIFTPDTGIRRFERKLASLRWTLQPEGENEILYTHESYVFQDDLSLYRDTGTSAGGCINWDVTLQSAKETGGVRSRSFMRFLGHNSQLDYLINFVNNDGASDISKISALLPAARIAAANSNQTEPFYYIFEEGNFKLVKMAVREDIWKQVLGTQTEVKVVELTYQDQVLHRFTLMKNKSGADWFPVEIQFHVNEPQHHVRMELNQLPEQRTDDGPAPMVAVFLDYYNTRAGGAEARIDRMVREVVNEEVRKRLTVILRDNNRLLVHHSQTEDRLNQQATIRHLAETTLEMDVAPDKRMENLRRRFAIPASVDIIVTGLYSSRPGNTNLMFRPIIIFLKNGRIGTSNIIFDTTSLLKSTGSRQLKHNAQERIAPRIASFMTAHVQVSRGSRGMTVDSVYRMIIENQFFCHSTDHGYHFQVLEKLKEQTAFHRLNSVEVESSFASSTPGYTFKNGWSTNAELEKNNGFVKTVSINKKNYQDIAVLYWDPVDGAVATFDEAVQMVEQLNNRRHEGHDDWRIPTLEEILMVSGYNRNTRDFLPFGFLADPAKIWTATQVDDSEKKRLPFTDDSLYYVLHRIKHAQQRKLQFDISHRLDKAFVLLVRSPGRVRGRRKASVQAELSVANMVFINTMEHLPMTTGSISQSIDSSVADGIRMATRMNKRMSVKNHALRLINTPVNAHKLSNIFFNPNLTPNAKVRGIINSLMIPNNIDLLVTGFYYEDKKRGLITLRPIVVYKDEVNIRTENLQFNSRLLKGSDASSLGKRLHREMQQKMAEMVKQLLGQA